MLPSFFSKSYKSFATQNIIRNKIGKYLEGFTVKQLVVLLLLVFLVLPVIELAQTGLVAANFDHPPPSIPAGSIVIELDGSVNPSTAPIQHSGDNYKLTSDLPVGQEIWIQRSSITLDGRGHQLRNNVTNFFSGITLNSTRNVTVKNFQVSGFYFGVKVQLQVWDLSDPANPYSEQIPDPSWIPKNNNIQNCIISGCLGAGIDITSASNTVIDQNLIANSEIGVGVDVLTEWSTETQITSNTLQNNAQGIVARGNANTISGNNIANNTVAGIALCSSNNDITRKYRFQ